MLPYFPPASAHIIWCPPIRPCHLPPYDLQPSCESHELFTSLINCTPEFSNFSPRWSICKPFIFVLVCFLVLCWSFCFFRIDSINYLIRGAQLLSLRDLQQQIQQNQNQNEKKIEVLISKPQKKTSAQLEVRIQTPLLLNHPPFHHLWQRASVQLMHVSGFALSGSVSPACVLLSVLYRPFVFPIVPTCAHPRGPWSELELLPAVVPPSPKHRLASPHSLRLILSIF